MNDGPNFKGESIFIWPVTQDLHMLGEGDAGQISDGHHTFDELYQHRCLLFCAWIEQSRETINFIVYAKREDSLPFQLLPWKSKLHADGSSLDEWFIAGLEPGEGIKHRIRPITYHLPLSMWDMCHAEERERAPEWDGHTSADVIERLQNWVGK